MMKLPVTKENLLRADATLACPLETVLGVAGLPEEMAKAIAPEYFEELAECRVECPGTPYPRVLCMDAGLLWAYSDGPIGRVLRTTFM